jgi:N-acetylglutamate synthase-like GNAT family acetyltransferase
MSEPVLEIMLADPCRPEASELISELSEEIARRYNSIADGSGLFKAEDTLVERCAFVIGYVEGCAVACGALRPLEGALAVIKSMSVRPQYRGRSYSQALLAELERLA